MLRDTFNRFFPTPAFLGVLSFGLDISDESLKFVLLSNTKAGVRLRKYGERKMPAGIIESGKIKDSKRLVDVLSALRKEEGIRSVRVSLPEEQVYLFKMRLDKEGLQNIREGIELSLEEHIPMPAAETIFDYDIISDEPKSLLLQIAAIPKMIIEEYLSVFKAASMSVLSFELEAQAISRAVVKKEDKDTYMIVDFGEKRTGIFIVSKGTVMFTSTLDVGGVMLNNMIAKSFQVSYEEAEKMKKEFGLQRNIENKEIFAVLLNSVSILRDEIAKHFLYWHTHPDEDGKSNDPIKKIILCGGDSNLIGLPDYLSVSLKTKVELADVWSNIMNTTVEVPEINMRLALTYASAIGLALGNFEHD